MTVMWLCDDCAELLLRTPIETAQYGGDADNDVHATAVRDATRAAVERGYGGPAPCWCVPRAVCLFNWHGTGA